MIKTCRPTTQNMSFQKAAQKVGPIKFTDYILLCSWSLYKFQQLLFFSFKRKMSLDDSGIVIGAYF